MTVHWVCTKWIDNCVWKESRKMTRHTHNTANTSWKFIKLVAERQKKHLAWLIMIFLLFPLLHLLVQNVVMATQMTKKETKVTVKSTVILCDSKIEKTINAHTHTKWIEVHPTAWAVCVNFFIKFNLRRNGGKRHLENCYFIYKICTHQKHLQKVESISFFVCFCTVALLMHWWIAESQLKHTVV